MGNLIGAVRFGAAALHREQGVSVRADFLEQRLKRLAGAFFAEIHELEEPAEGVRDLVGRIEPEDLRELTRGGSEHGVTQQAKPGAGARGSLPRLLLHRVGGRWFIQ